MSMYGGNKTRKVTTYGRQKSRVITMYEDFSPGRNVPSSPMPDTPVRRPALASKLSRDNINLPATPVPESRKGKVIIGPARQIEISSGSDYSPPALLLSQQVRRIKRYNRAVIPASPASSAATPVKRAAILPSLNAVAVRPQREIIDAVEIDITARPSSSRRASRKPFRELSINLDDELNGRITRLSLADESKSSTTSTRSSLSSPLDPLNSLRAVCDRSDILSLSELLDAVAALLPGTANRESLKVVKAGEATYSEVYGVSHGDSQAVIKIVPLSEVNEAASEASGSEDMPDRTRPDDVAKEITIGKRMSEVSGSGFIKCHGAFIAKGVYDDRMLKEWDDYEQQWGTENVRPSCFSADQLFAVLCLSDGGYDLEASRFDTKAGWRQVASLFWQVAKALGTAEKELEFEHRDLHEGQVLVIADGLPDSTDDITDYSDADSTGVHAQIIDFGLSRLRNADGSIHTAVPSNIMDGEGAQWDVYRAMRADAGDDWETYRPQSNLRWLLYLDNYVLTSCELKVPKATAIRPKVGSRGTAAPTTKAAKEKQREIAAYKTLMRARAVMEATFAKDVATDGKVPKRSGRKTAERDSACPYDPLCERSAEGLVRWARVQGWVA